MKLGIIMPAYNEEKRIGNTLEKYSQFFDKASILNNFEYKILVVINNTIDKTEEIVAEYSAKNKNIIYVNFKEGGKGFAVIEGFKEFVNANYDLIGFVDSDMATIPEEYYKLVQNIKNYHGIIASRYIKGAIVNPKQSTKRIIASRMFNFVLRTMFLINYRDTQCGAKIFRRQIIEKILPDLSITKWAFDVDLLYQIKKNKFKIKEYPTIWSDQDYSKVNFSKDGSKMILSITQLRIKNSIFKRILIPFEKPIVFLWKQIK